jgi:dipeptidyl aminopeptidase/acylaminoacyl peptidase
VGNLLLQRGFAVLVPERRGYGQSEGLPFYDEVGNNVGARFVGRLEAETGDALAALDFLKTLPWVDQRRIGIMGWSLGGIVSVFAASRSDRFQAAVDQAGGSLNPTPADHPIPLRVLMPAAVHFWHRLCSVLIFERHPRRYPLCIN